MRILITNDDGIFAPGIVALSRAAQAYGEVKLVAPDRERSACGHAMTMREPLRVQRQDIEGIEGYMVNGLPVDCVNVGLAVAWPDGCDLVLSGINNGPNLGFDVTYSGTVAGAMEGCINGIFSISVSMARFVAEAPLHFETAVAWLTDNLAMILEAPRKPRVFLNLNIPAVAIEEIQGHKITKMGGRVYEDRVERREDPWGRPYYWQGGIIVKRGVESDTDVEAASQGFVSINPISLDWTDHAFADTLRGTLGGGHVYPPR